MKIKNTVSYTLITPEENSLNEFIAVFKRKFYTDNQVHIIIDFSENFNIESSDFELFLDIANTFRKNGTSFVLIIKTIDIDSVPDEINIVPTLEEAIDIIEMDAIERDLLGL